MKVSGIVILVELILDGLMSAHKLGPRARDIITGFLLVHSGVNHGSTPLASPYIKNLHLYL